jgi:hypothetical protein
MSLSLSGDGVVTGLDSAASSDLGSELAAKLDSTAYQPGLTLITSESFSAVSSVSINECFTSIYENYRIVIRATTSGSAFIYWRLRVSGSDDSGSNYVRQGVYGTSSTVSAFTSTDNLGYFTATLATGLHVATADFFSPNKAANTTALVNDFNVAPQIAIQAFNHTLATAYDGLTIFPSTGNFTGTIRIYGYRD